MRKHVHHLLPTHQQGEGSPPKEGRGKNETGNNMEETMPDKDEEVPVQFPGKGFLTHPNDPTVGGGGIPFAGIGWSCLPDPLKRIGAEARRAELPDFPPRE